MLLWCLFSGRAQAWEDASGRVPGAVFIVDRVVNKGGRPDVAALRPDIPAAVITFMQRAWARMPLVRPTASEAAAVLSLCRADACAALAAPLANNTATKPFDSLPA